MGAEMLRLPRQRSRRTGRAPGAGASEQAHARTYCPACGLARYRCTMTDGSAVILDPAPRDGGPFLVNPYSCVVVSVRTPSQCRGSGFVEHGTVCPARNPRSGSAV
jgi:hypothetical protein